MARKLTSAMSLSTFTGLPAEVRNQIYEHLFEGAVIEDHGFSPNPITVKNYHLSITLTNKQIRAESLSVLHSSTTLHFRIGQAGVPPIPAKVLHEIRKVRIPAHRLQTLDFGPFERLDILLLDVTIEHTLWKLYQRERKTGTTASNDIADMIHISMTLGVFEHSWDVEKVWRDKSRKFRILCWISSWARGDTNMQPVLVDIDRGIVLQDQG